jgi:Helix-loop-helix DNA-binding domain
MLTCAEAGGHHSSADLNADMMSSNPISLEHMASQIPLQAEESTLPNGQLIWQLPSYNAQLDSRVHDVQSTAAAVFSPFESYGSEQSGSLVFSQMDADNFWLSELEGPRTFQGTTESEHENLSSVWTASPLMASTYQEISSPCPRLTMSPSWQVVTPSTTSTSAWISAHDSAYGSPPSSGHGSGSSQAHSMMNATHYFANPDMKDSPGDSSEAAPMSTADPRHQALSKVEVAPAAKAAGAAQTRSKQHAHSKVEKRYRMNINSKIEQLRRILPSNPQPNRQSLTYINKCGTTSSRRKSDTELSKGDVLSRAISHVQQLRNEIHQLTSQNIELKEKLALLRTLATEE